MDGRLREKGVFPAGRLSYDTQIPILAQPHAYFNERTTATVYPEVVEWPFGRDDGMYDFIEFQTNAMNVAITGYLEWDEIILYG
jgi:hypothetical protein